jgi:hypothetical protein
VETNNNLSKQVNEFSQMLTEDNILLINFDNLCQCLKDTARILEGNELLVRDLNLLRQDYESRIIGMTKALTVADKNGRGYSDTLEFIDRLPHLTGSELIDCYRKISARFRDTFPASYGLLRQPSNRSGRLSDLNSFK